MRELESATLYAGEIEDVTETENEPVPFAFDITWYGADFPVEELVSKLESGEIILPVLGPGSSEDEEQVGSQLNYVWPQSMADRFIESLILGLPVPGIFLAVDGPGRLLVLDGHHRLRTLQMFYKSFRIKRPYRLGRTVQDNFSGKRYADLDPLYRQKLDNRIIHATIVRQLEHSDDKSSIYTIFERLNSGGFSLQPQETRTALFHGKLAQLLQDLNEQPAWRFLFGNRSRRQKDREMILRFFAFHYMGDKYAAPMKDFLNRYMAKNRNLELHPACDLLQVFDRTTEILKNAIGKAAFRPMGRLNAAALDSVMIGVANRLKHGPVAEQDEIRARHKKLFSNQAYINAIKSGTSEESSVKTRLRLATEAFANVK